MYIDTHCHVFSEYYDNIDEIVNKCKNNGVSKIIINGCDIETNKEVLELVNKYDIIYGTIGFHPTELNDFRELLFFYCFSRRKVSHFILFLTTSVGNLKTLILWQLYTIRPQILGCKHKGSVNAELFLFHKILKIIEVYV